MMNRVMSNAQLPHDTVLVTEVRPHDIMLGRGTGPNENPGNRFFRNIITSNKSKYVKAKTRKEKEVVIQKTIAAVRELNGRFLKKLTKPMASKFGVQPNANAVLHNETCVFQVVQDKATIRLKTQLAFRYAINGQGANADNVPSVSSAEKHRRTIVHNDENRAPVFVDLTKPTSGRTSSSVLAESDSRGTLSPTTTATKSSPSFALKQKRKIRFNPSPATCFTPVTKRPCLYRPKKTKSPVAPIVRSGLDVLAEAGAVMASNERYHSRSPSDVTSVWAIQASDAARVPDIADHKQSRWGKPANFASYRTPPMVSTKLNFERRYQQQPVIRQEYV